MTQNKRNIIFFTMSRIVDIERRGIYSDLLRQFRKEGWGVYILTPHERSIGKPTELVEHDGVHILGVKTLNLQKTSIVEKGIGQILVEGQYKRAINRFLSGVKFDIILYSTPPIMFSKLVSYMKRRNPHAMTYLLLKDIFPQNAVDIGMMKKTGLKGILYKYFRSKEKKLYALSDFIGCMSPANAEYVLKHNADIPADKVEVAPNSVELTNYFNLNDSLIEETDKNKINALRYNTLSSYDLPTDRPIFIYGGNLGKPQCVHFLIDCLESNSDRDDCHFVVIGSGTEYPRLKDWFDSKHPYNVSLMKGLPKEKYDELVRFCDVGLIFLDHRFTIPNYPSRILSYMENKMPVLCATDPNTDVGRIAEENGYGFWCESNKVEAFTEILDKMIQADRKVMGKNGFDFLVNNYLVEHTYRAIVAHYDI